MRKPAVLITGSGGEIGHGLISRLSQSGERPILSLDLKGLPADSAARVQHHFTGSVLDESLLERVLAEFDVDRVFHLAALLSMRSEFTPAAAHRVNVEGTLKLLEFAQREAESHGRPVAFLYPSSVAAHGLPDLESKRRAGRVAEDDWTMPTTMYGCNKLYCEQLGRYYADHYKQLAAAPRAGRVDFRGLRFPGLISADTVPSGGTSDFAPEMLHAAARGEPYDCFVRSDTRIPFMVMPDAVEALLRLAAVRPDALSRRVYNVRAFSTSAEEFRARVTKAFPGARIRFEPDEKRQRIVDSWPEDVDDGAARRDWDFAPRYDLEGAFRVYLLPTIRQRYGATT